MGNLRILVGARVEGQPGQEREMVIARLGGAEEWRTTLPKLLDQVPATAALVEHVVRLYLRQRPTEAAAAGMAGLLVVVRMAFARANEEAAEGWEWAEEVA